MPVNDRVLVIDDHERWRQQIHSILRDGQWQVVGEGADGLEGVEKAAVLAPDIILLDVELPGLNGLDAARRILARTPATRIAFLSAHRSWDIAAAAMGTGARGSLLKSQAGHELLPAMTAIAAGKRFISATLTGHADNGRDAPRCHEAGFYTDGAALLDAFVRFAERALSAGKALIVVLDQQRRRALRDRLKGKGLDVERAVREGRYIALDPGDVLSRVMVDGWPDDTRFWSAATRLVADASRASRGTPPLVAVCGIGTARLLRDGHADAAVRLEDLWSEAATAYNLDVLCGYSMDLFGNEVNTDALGRIRAQHSATHT
jgi:two-component system NarL family response regulator